MERVITKNKLKIYYKISIKSFLINISITQHIRINYKFFHLCMNVVTWEILYIPRNFENMTVCVEASGFLEANNNF